MFAQKPESTDSIKLNCVSESLRLADFEWIHKGGWNELYNIPDHPLFDSLLTKEVSDSLLQIINSRKEETGDTIHTSSFFYCWKPYFEWLADIDPHYTVCPAIVFDVDYNSKNYKKEVLSLSRRFRKEALIVPVSALNVNDTLIVSSSLDDKLQKGDIILSINGISTDKLLRVNYSVRHSPLYMLLSYYSFDTFCPEYSFEIIRKGERKAVSVPGMKYIEATYKLSCCDAMDNNIKILDNGIGYIKIPEFFYNNGRLIRIIRKNIIKFKAQGCKSVILDLRGNPGGNGDAFNKLMSLFIDKPEIDYCRFEKIKVSGKTKKDYAFLSGYENGQLVDMPDKFCNKTMPLENKMFIKGVDYYVLMDEGTQSIAASFCNILQYNHSAKLVGEPLLSNALPCGDIINFGRRFYSIGKVGKDRLPFYACLIESGISTTETDENSLATDGILKPDISIPYNIDALSKGDDNMLTGLISIINSSDK